MIDDVLASVVRTAEADPETLAVVLHGSRAAGHERPDSDALFADVRSLMERHGIRTHDEWKPDQLR